MKGYLSRSRLVTCFTGKQTRCADCSEKVSIDTWGPCGALRLWAHFVAMNYDEKAALVASLQSGEKTPWMLTAADRLFIIEILSEHLSGELDKFGSKTITEPYESAMTALGMELRKPTIH